MPRHRLLAAAILLAGFVSVIAKGQSLSLTDAQRTKLREIVRSDSEASSLYAKLQRTADGALTAVPDPVATIQSEGKLNSDPAKIRTQQSLKDMPKLGALGFTYAVSGEEKYAA